MTAPAIFLPGILMPASLRYRPLFALLPDCDCRAKELEVYAGDTPPPDYSTDDEVEGLARYADETGLERFHLSAHSGGGAVALAFVAAHPERVLSLALDEPATDFSEPDRAEVAEVDRTALSLPPEQRLPAFLRANLRDGTPLPPPPTGEPPPWMAKRPAGMAAFARALVEHRVPDGAWQRFDRPVYFSYGSESHERWARMAERLRGQFPDYRAELYEGVHHLNTSHQAQPERVAERLRELWARAEAAAPPAAR